ncbi:unnamed protein product [Prunus armeniaca]|uniref:RRM domain-containing protein n=1 Tax=Prunus armeniaca TaxID=36596 RepID=A0A6J5WCW8_PRUAR|nr:unnamed protein product [Prunus armeniaca]CAB4299389.1 unnamed protein product [Prunus armeniaca]
MHVKHVIDARIISDRETGRSRGFGFITFTSSEEASSAIQALDGHELHGRRVRVNYATDRPRPNFGDGGGFETASIGGGFGNNINLGVSGGVGGADDFVGGADNSFGSGGAQLGENKGGFGLDDPLKGNDRDDDDDAGNFLKRA